MQMLLVIFNKVNVIMYMHIVTFINKIVLLITCHEKERNIYIIRYKSKFLHESYMCI